ncbi:MAG TPA: VCBS repeat-containing protein [Polyangiaceae bacterium]
MRFICVLAVAAVCTACGARSALATLDDPHAPGASSRTVHTADAGCTWGFAPLVSYTAGVAPAAIAIADLDGDGHADLVVNNYGGEPGGITLNTLRNRGDATFAPWQSYASTVSFSMMGGPFVSAASADLLVGCDLFPNNGGGVFGAPLWYSPAGACGFQDSHNNLAVADFDGDGRLDFGWALLLNGVVVYLNRGGGSFDAVETMPNPVTPYMNAMASADFDRDGRPDLAGVSWGYGYPSYLRIFHNTGAARFAETDLAQGNQSPQVIAAGDLNGDGWPDLVIDDAGTGMEVLRNREDGTFGPPTTYTFPEEVRSITIGDLNGDGASDVVFGGYGLNDLGVFFNRGDGTFAPAVHWDVTNNPWAVALGDLNGDGHLDVAVAVTGASNGSGVNVFLSQCE